MNMLQISYDSPCNHKAFNDKHHNDFTSRSKPAFDAVLFDLFDTLVLLGDEHDSYIQSLKKTHRYLSDNGLDCSFNAFKQAYFKAVDKISAETAYSLEEPHFSMYIEGTLTELGVNLKDKTFLAIESVNEFSREFKKYVKLESTNRRGS